MLNLSLARIADICQGQLLGQDVTINSVSIDSRKLAKNALFVALQGEQVDGHDYANAAINAGAVAVLVERPVANELNQVIVSSTEQALAKIARAYRDEFAGKVIAITGSSGKTTTRRMLTAILQQAGEVSATEGNLNNDLGVPLTILAADQQADFWAVEMGAAQQGDIHRLMQIANPHISVITNIGNAHVGRFGGEEAIAKAKSEIYQDLALGAVAVINWDSDYAMQLLALHQPALTYSLSNNKADVYATAINLNDSYSSLVLHHNGQQCLIQLPAAGLHNVSNALCASACAIATGVSLTHIAYGLAKFSGEQGRLQYKQASSGALLIDDSYNANPESVKAGIDVLAMQKQRTILVLGDMAELGNDSSRYHAQVGEYAKQKGIQQLFSCGVDSAFASQAFGEQGQHFNDKTSLVEHLHSQLSKDVAVLIKGSRSSAMDVIVKQLELKAGAACC